MPVVRYLALGDSYTIGESVDESERWSLQLASMIQTSPQIAKQFGGTEGGGMEVTIIARTGWTTDELWDGIQAREINPPYDLVSLLIGVNNQYRGLDIEEYRKSFVFLLNKSIEYVGGDADRVIVLSIPDWGVTPFAGDRDSKKIADEINQYNAVNRAETEKAGAHYIDITPISREAVNDPSLIASDGLHPSAKMYAEWARLALPVALEILTK
ncbi:MAG TPA: SGNH/GDSL hydrolase family protein [Anaerolineales bacterium]|nr:SGNH/GDSL hydrolase family protein [Anaerolineales bacterium]HQX15022.1 SGNH/GDSL hydrolase family protein [Anaerolineales bacterium]